MTYCRIPGHITGLYIFAVVNLCALLNITLVNGDVYVIDVEKNSTVDTIEDRMATFGGFLPEEGLVGRVVYVNPTNACTTIVPQPKELGMVWIALIARGNCHFDYKVWNAQQANFAAAIVHNYEGSDALIPMAGESTYSEEVKIPALFVGYTGGMALAHKYNYTNKSVLVRLQEVNDQSATSFFLPFLVILSICVVGCIGFVITRAIRYFRYIHQSRLSKSALKRIPTRKFKKGDYFESCAICLEDYEEGEKLRVLPCNHTYHCKCIDPWLTKRKKTCPQCKRRVIPGHDTDSESDAEGEEPTAGGGASETTPLLGHNNNPRSGRSGQRSSGGSLEQSAGLLSSSVDGGQVSPSRGHPAASEASEGPVLVVISETDIAATSAQPTTTTNTGTVASATSVATTGKSHRGSKGKRQGSTLSGRQKMADNYNYGADNSECGDDVEGHQVEEVVQEGAVGGVGISDRKDFEEVVIEGLAENPRRARDKYLVVVEPPMYSTNPAANDDGDDDDGYSTTSAAHTEPSNHLGDTDTTPLTLEDSRSLPSSDHSSINYAFVASNSGDEDGENSSSSSGGGSSSGSGKKSGSGRDENSGGGGGAKRKQRRNSRSPSKGSGGNQVV